MEMNRIIKDPTYDIYKNGGNVERKGKEITKEQLRLFASERTPEETELDIGSVLKEYPDWKKENPGKTFDDFLEEQGLKSIELRDGGKVIDLRSYMRSKDPKIKKIDLASLFEDTARTVASLSPAERDQVNDLLRRTLKSMKGD